MIMEKIRNTIETDKTTLVRNDWNGLSAISVNGSCQNKNINLLYFSRASIEMNDLIT